MAFDLDKFCKTLLRSAKDVRSTDPDAVIFVRATYLFTILPSMQSMVGIVANVLRWNIGPRGSLQAEVVNEQGAGCRLNIVSESARLGYRELMAVGAGSAEFIDDEDAQRMVRVGSCSCGPI